MLLSLTSYHYIIIFSLTIIISYFFNLYAKKSGVPAVLMLIGLGILINYSLRFSGVGKPDLLPVLEVLGVTGLILIVLEAALDLHLLKEKLSLIARSFLSALVAFVATSYLSALALGFLMEVDVLNVLLYTIPLSILSSAIILPSIDDLSPDKKEFMIYESTFSDIIGIVAFYAVLTIVSSSSSGEVYGEVFGNLALTIIVSVLISYLLIYIFQKIKGHGKLFLLIAILLLLYSVGKLFHLSSLIIILIFGVILNNYTVFFGGDFKKFIDLKKVAGVLEDMKIITAESAFVVRTFFFIIFGWSVYLGTLLNLKVVGIGLIMIVLIYLIRGVVLFVFNGKNLFPEIFLAPRGLITILLFFAIPEHLVLGKEFHGILLFVIITSCLIMTWSMISFKKRSVREVQDVDQNEFSGEN
jgi:Kef-type K+ transport system membrane component KefB